MRTVVRKKNDLTIHNPPYGQKRGAGETSDAGFSATAPNFKGATGMKILHKEIEFCDECPYQVIFDQYPYCINAGKSLDSNNLIPGWCPLENDQRCEREWDALHQSHTVSCGEELEYVGRRWDFNKFPFCPCCGKRIEVKDESDSD